MHVCHERRQGNTNGRNLETAYTTRAGCHGVPLASGTRRYWEGESRPYLDWRTERDLGGDPERLFIQPQVTPGLLENYGKHSSEPGLPSRCWWWGEGRGARGRVRASTWATDLRRCPKHAYGHSPGLLVKEVPYALHNPQCKKFEFGKYLLATVWKVYRLVTECVEDGDAIWGGVWREGGLWTSNSKRHGKITGMIITSLSYCCHVLTTKSA
jgi:hypothetical protein